MSISKVIAKNSFEKLYQAFNEHNALAGQGPAQQTNKADLQGFSEALANDAFKKRHMTMEPILLQSGDVLAYECLSRPSKSDGTEYSIGPFTEMAYQMGLAIEMDTLLMSNALKKSHELSKTPITLNTSIQSAMDLDFWNDMRPRMDKKGIQNIIIELLEHDIDPHSDIRHLHQLREQGLRFALDDLSLGQSHENRLEAFGELVGYVKFDGPLVRAYFDGAHHDQDGTYLSSTALEDTVKLLRSELPHALLIAEYVTNKDEAEELFHMGILGVQGRELNENSLRANPKNPDSYIETSLGFGS